MVLVSGRWDEPVRVAEVVCLPQADHGQDIPYERPIVARVSPCFETAETLRPTAHQEAQAIFDHPVLDPALDLRPKKHHPHIAQDYHVVALVDLFLVSGQIEPEQPLVQLVGDVDRDPRQYHHRILVEKRGDMSGLHEGVPDEENSDEPCVGVHLGFVPGYCARG